MPPDAAATERMTYGGDTKRRLRADNAARYDQAWRDFQGLAGEVRGAGAQVETLLALARVLRAGFQAALDDDGPDAHEVLRAAREALDDWRRAAAAFDRHFARLRPEPAPARALAPKVEALAEALAPAGRDRHFPLDHPRPAAVRAYLGALRGMFDAIARFPAEAEPLADTPLDELRRAPLAALQAALGLAGRCRRELYAALHWAQGRPPMEVELFHTELAAEAREGVANLDQALAEFDRERADLRARLDGFTGLDALATGWQAHDDLLRGEALEAELRPLTPEYVTTRRVPEIKQGALMLTHAQARNAAYREALAGIGALRARFVAAVRDGLAPLAETVGALLDACGAWTGDYRRLVFARLDELGRDATEASFHYLQTCTEYVARYLVEVAPSHERAIAMATDRVRRDADAQRAAARVEQEEETARRNAAETALHAARRAHARALADELAAYHDALYPVIEEYAAAPAAPPETDLEGDPEGAAGVLETALDKVRGPFRGDLAGVVAELVGERDHAVEDGRRRGAAAQRRIAGLGRQRRLLAVSLVGAVLAAGVFGVLWGLPLLSPPPVPPRPIEQLIAAQLADAERVLADQRAGTPALTAAAQALVAARRAMADADPESYDRAHVARLNALLVRLALRLVWAGEFDQAAALAQAGLARVDGAPAGASEPVADQSVVRDPHVRAVLELLADRALPALLDRFPAVPARADDLWGERDEALLSGWAAEVPPGTAGLATAAAAGDAGDAGAAGTAEEQRALPPSDWRLALADVFLPAADRETGAAELVAAQADDGASAALAALRAVARLLPAGDRARAGFAALAGERRTELDALLELARRAARLRHQRATPFLVRYFLVLRHGAPDAAAQALAARDRPQRVRLQSELAALAAQPGADPRAHYLLWFVDAFERGELAAADLRRAFDAEAGLWVGDAAEPRPLPVAPERLALALADPAPAPWLKRLALAVRYRDGALPHLAVAGRAWRETPELHAQVRALRAELERDAASAGSWQRDFRRFFAETGEAPPTNYAAALETLFAALPAGGER